MTNYQKMLNALNSDILKAEEILYKANAYREFAGNPVAYIEAHEYELSEGNTQYKVAKECYMQTVRIWGSAADFILDTFKESQ